MKRLTMILGIITLLLFSLAHAQQRWQRSYGGTGRDEGWDVKQTSDGGYIVVGHAGPLIYPNVYLIKTNASGDTIWTRNYGDTTYDLGYSVQQTTDGGYIVAGYKDISGRGLGDFYLIKTDASGDTLWTRTYGGTDQDLGYSVQQTSDGGYIVAGYTYSFGSGPVNVYLIKTNVSGDTLWTRTYGGTRGDYGTSVRQTTDGGYIITGRTYSFGAGATDVYLIKTNTSGDTLWTRTYGGPSADEGYSVQQTTDGGYIIAGLTTSFGAGNCDAYLIKTNASGNTLWTRTFGGTDADYANSVQQTSDGGYIVAGYTYSFGAGHADVWLIKTNASGDTLWTRTYGGAYDDYANSVQQTTDGGYIVAGVTSSFGDSAQVYLIKTDSLGISTGVEESRQGDKETRRQGERLRATPNPFTSFATLPGHEAERFSLYDVSGRMVGNYKGDRVGEGLAAGVYFLKHQEMLKQVQHDEIVRVVKVR